MALKWVREPLERSMYYYRAVVGKTVYSVDHDHRNGRWYAWRRDPGVVSGMGADGQIKGSAALGWATTPAKAKKFAEADAVTRFPGPQKRTNPDSPEVTRYLRAVRAQQRKGAKNVQLTWTTETIGDTPVYSAQLDGARIRIYAPSRTMGDLYQIYAGHQHYANAHSLREAKATGREAAAYYSGRGPNSMGRMANERERAQGARANPRSYGPEMLIHAGHAIQQEGADYIVQPYGRAFRSLSGAKSWIDRHVASEMRHPTRNPARRDTWMIAAMAEPKPKRAKLTKDQKAALAAYNFALSQEDRYLGSVFVTPSGQRRVEETTAAAYARCKALGMTHEHGL